MATGTSKTTTKTTTTTKPKTTTTKASTTATSMTAAAKAAATTSGSSAPVVVEGPQPVVAGPVMRKRELVDAVVAKSGKKKKDVKPVVEAMLMVLGSALQDGRELNLQPMGKFKVNREKKMAEGKVLVARIRQAKDLPTSTVRPNPKDSDKGTDDAPKAAKAAEAAE